ncbi:hypothetical protein PMAYCL1PPCAC_30552 [Pristionchus mayeri]|uniref:Uncharacterized protein n=1 Tax=Pristionchus mayeri TaxID=1317129 RepID=A0AAN5IBT5_9BILA|nr:hypothetical protein PMAYCL1PPCAC_30552 [Pristionchus mayeri]
MMFRLLLFALLLQSAHSQLHHVQGINHPGAGGPDIGSIGIARGLGGDGLGMESDHSDGLVDPDGRKIIAPLKKHTQRREEQLKEENEKIRQILEASKKLTETRSSPLSTWLWTLFGCSLLISCGIVPAFILPANASEYFHSTEGKSKLNLLLSFAVGSLLGDVFLHLLPETFAAPDADMVQIGLYTIAGLVSCLIVEKVVANTEDSQHQVCAVMNLIGNLIDNFTHGLAIGAAYQMGVKSGLLVTFAILLHEIPHEVSDFAILLRADYNRGDAIKAQLLTATGGVLGACSALFMHTDALASSGVSWILPFTAGGFINIALVQILPELMEETRPRQNTLQALLIIAGVCTMGALNTLLH